MRLNVFKTTGLILLVGVLMPVGMLMGSESHELPAVTSSTANWYNVEQASNLFNHMNTLALKVRKEVARLQVQGDQISWKAQSARLARARNDINTMGDDLEQLHQMNTRLEPWQQSLIQKITPRAYEMADQLDAAINTMNQYQSKDHLALTEYPQNINQIYRNANQISDTIGTVTQYAHAEQKMEALNKMNGTKAGS